MPFFHASWPPGNAGFVGGRGHRWLQRLGHLLAYRPAAAQADYDYEHHLRDDVDLERLSGADAVSEHVLYGACPVDLQGEGRI